VHTRIRQFQLAVALVLGGVLSVASAALPPLTPEQEQAAAAKKQQAAAQAEKEKQQLATTMDEIASRWRGSAQKNGWPMNQPTPVSAEAVSNPSAGQAPPSAQPGGRLGAAAADMPVRSEKQGTAPPSEDVKNPAEKGK
jgi:type II secretory pathway pseudopilin PulG